MADDTAFFFLWADEKMHFATLFFYAIVSVSVNGGSALDFYFSGTDLLRNCKTNRHEDTNHSFFLLARMQAYPRSRDCFSFLSAPFFSSGCQIDLWRC